MSETIKCYHQRYDVEKSWLVIKLVIINEYVEL